MIVISCDPGVSGAFSILEDNKTPQIHRIPIKKITVNKKEKKVYDLPSIVSLLNPYYKKDVLFVQEQVSVMPGEGGVSAFGFGKSAGTTLGIATALEFKVVEVRPATWKKFFPELESQEIVKLREEQKSFKEAAKTIKGNKEKKENKKIIDKIGRQIKSGAKSGARELVSRLFPQLADDLKQINADGLAESLLIAIYGREHYNELVQNS